MGDAVCNVIPAPKAVYKLVLANAKTIVILDEPQGLDPESILILGIQDGFWIGFRSRERSTTTNGFRITCAARVRNDGIGVRLDFRR
jgi:hypothetical protein